MLKLLGKKIFTILHHFFFVQTFESVSQTPKSGFLMTRPILLQKFVNENVIDNKINLLFIDRDCSCHLSCYRTCFFYVCILSYMYIEVDLVVIIIIILYSHVVGRIM